jgi:hypothetical protein
LNTIHFLLTPGHAAGIHPRHEPFAPRPPHLRTCAPPFGGGVGYADALS